MVRDLGLKLMKIIETEALCNTSRNLAHATVEVCALFFSCTSSPEELYTSPKNRHLTLLARHSRHGDKTLGVKLGKSQESEMGQANRKRNPVITARGQVHKILHIHDYSEQ